MNMAPGMARSRAVEVFRLGTRDLQLARHQHSPSSSWRPMLIDFTDGFSLCYQAIADEYALSFAA